MKTKTLWLFQMVLYGSRGSKQVILDLRSDAVILLSAKLVKFHTSVFYGK